MVFVNWLQCFKHTDTKHDVDKTVNHVSKARTMMEVVKTQLYLVIVVSSLQPRTFTFELTKIAKAVVDNK